MLTLGIYVAMRAEASPLVQAFGLSPNPEHSDRFSGQWGSGSPVAIELWIGGLDARHGVDRIGTIPAALRADRLLREIKPDFLINAGTAGGYARHGARIGEVFLSSDHFRFHDRRIELPGGYREYGLGSRAGWDTRALSEKLQIPRAAISTGDSLDCTSHDQAWIDGHGGQIKEMEAAAIAWVAEEHGTPFLAIKAVTDLVDVPHPTADQFLANLALATQTLSAAVVRIVNELALAER